MNGIVHFYLMIKLLILYVLSNFYMISEPYSEFIIRHKIDLTQDELFIDSIYDSTALVFKYDYNQYCISLEFNQRIKLDDYNKMMKLLDSGNKIDLVLSDMKFECVQNYNFYYIIIKFKIIDYKGR